MSIGTKTISNSNNINLLWKLPSIDCPHRVEIDVAEDVEVSGQNIFVIGLPNSRKEVIINLLGQLKDLVIQGVQLSGNQKYILSTGFLAKILIPALPKF